MFRVEWLGSALNELTAIWSDAELRLREAITSSTHEIDQRLRSDPHGEGESREEGRRILLVSPLGILYRIKEDRRTATVLHVWVFHARST